MFGPSMYFNYMICHFKGIKYKQLLMIASSNMAAMVDNGFKFRKIFNGNEKFGGTKKVVVKI
jgi:hypothetical protein